jgi:hypothetical protein
MNKEEIIDALNEKYNLFIEYIISLSQEDYEWRYQQKWTAGEQLEHIVICAKPLVQVFNMDKNLIQNTFGKTYRQGRSYEALKSEYLYKLSEGGKAPERFLPDISTTKQKADLIEKLRLLVHDLCAAIEKFSEEDLDSLCIPHPLFGQLTLREMLYNALYHVEHHQQLAIKYLDNR